jgi:hypothetical protein
MALRAIAEHGDLLVGNEVEVAICVVIDFHFSSFAHPGQAGVI